MDSNTPKKRPLEEVSPNILYSPPKRRASFGFEMASIPTTSVTNEHNQSSKVSKLPQPFTAANSNSNQLSHVNDFQSILSMQERLSRKPPLTISAPFDYKSTISHVGSNELQDTLSSLNQECKEKHRKLEYLTDELNRLRRIYRNYQQKVETTTSEIHNVQARLEYMEEEIVNHVGNEEKLIEIKLNENRIKLDNQFTEIEFEMASEVQEVRNFDYTELVHKIDALKQSELKLMEEIKQQLEANDEKYNAEVDKLKKLLEDEIKGAQQEENESKLVLEQLLKELEEITADYQSRLSEFETQSRQVEGLKFQITNIEETMNNYVNVKKKTELELSNVKRILDEKVAQDKIEQQEFDTVYLEYSSLHNKVKKHDEHRRILENSIMEYQGKIRVYAIAKEDEYENCFSKYFQEDTPSSFIMEEFSHFVKTVIRGTNVSIISQYLPGGTIICQTMNQLLHIQNQPSTWQFQFEYQAVEINQSIDLLTGSKLTQSSLFESQKMRIDEPSRVGGIINGFDVNKDVIVHVITVMGVKEKKQFESRLVLVDISKVDSNEQMNIMQKLLRNDKLTYLDRVLEWISKRSNPLVISKINDLNAFNLLKTINLTNVASKKKEISK